MDREVGDRQHRLNPGGNRHRHFQPEDTLPVRQPAVGIFWPVESKNILIIKSAKIEG